MIEAFRSTLEEVAGSQLLVNCVDASSDDVLGNIEAVNKVLDDIEVGDIEQIILWNKIDRLSDDQLDKLKEIDFDYKSKNKKIKDSFFLSAITGQGVEILRDFFLKHPSL